MGDLRIMAVICGDLLEDMTPELLAETFRGAESVLIPGLHAVTDVVVRRTSHPDEVVVMVTFLGEEIVSGGDYAGDKVTPQFVSSYITGAGDYWCGHANEFSPTWAIAEILA